eukprot:3216311-Prymnesium_polylepis.1
MLPYVCSPQHTSESPGPMHSVAESPGHSVADTPGAGPKGSTIANAHHRADIDGLRAVAVTAVILYHMDHKYLPGGFVGVDVRPPAELTRTRTADRSIPVWIPCSSFVVSGSLLRSGRADFVSFVLSFYARRIQRLVPALILTVLVTSFTISLLVEPELQILPEHYMSGQLALLGWANVYFAGESKSYWNQGIRSLEYNPFTHMWSLGVEEQYYLFFPLLLVLGYGRRVMHSSSPRPHWPFGPLTLFALLCALSFTLSAYWSANPSSQNVAYYLLPSRFWQLMIGAMVNEWHDARSHKLAS